MKKRSLIYVFFLVVFVACSSSDDNKSEPDKIEPFLFQFDDHSYTIVDALAVDNKGLTKDTHHEYSFVMADAAINPVFNAGMNPQYKSDASILIHLRLYSKGEDFKTGTYNICCMNSYFSLTIFRGNETFGTEEGTVTISGQHPNYKIEFKDIVLINNDNTLSFAVENFTYDNGFRFHDNSSK